ncbi:MAG: hypothetical protein CL609_24210 [Anaerolineaceae bacterium]|nr:hypothetical protein [Anaerolineaceae bacterium]
MKELLSLQELEYLENGFEVSKILVQAGFQLESPALMITWGQVAEVFAHTLVDYGLTADRLDENCLVDLIQSIQTSLVNEKPLPWQTYIRLLTNAHPTIRALLEPPDMEDDEGSLTEQYENASRLGDDEGYWANSDDTLTNF